MLFRVVIACLVLMGCYILYEIYQTTQYYNDLRTPLASFTVIDNGEGQEAVTIVEFLNYNCPVCKDAHAILVDYAKTTPGIRLAVRPIPNEGDAEIAARRALAAGLQGKFWEMDTALSAYKGALNDKFYRETAALYDIDYDRMIADADGPKVFAMAKDNAAALFKADIRFMPAIMIGKTIYELNAPLTLPDLIRMVRAQQQE